MKTICIDTNDLEGVALDWAVTKSLGYDHDVTEGSEWGLWGWATDWAQGGQIIEDECLDLEHRPAGASREWYAVSKHQAIFGSGDTPLIAAMRCFVALSLGLDVDVPEELIK